MKQKHLDAWMARARISASLSPCTRAQYGTLLVDPVNNVPIVDGYNGPPREGPSLCGGDCCTRTKLGIPSGKDVQEGCIHSEVNAVCNAARTGRSTKGAWAFVTGEPCLMCAKVLYQAGVAKVYVISGGYTTTVGVEFLRSFNIEVVEV